jgi:hypothetical protein
VSVLQKKILPALQAVFRLRILQPPLSSDGLCAGKSTFGASAVRRRSPAEVRCPLKTLGTHVQLK